MNIQNAIFIFTKDRSWSLKETLDSINCIQMKKYIFDDSFYILNQIENQKIISDISDAVYVGDQEFKDFLNNQRIDIDKYSFLLRKVSSKDWNLGYVRNFALLYAIFKRIDRVLFIDDDITITESNVIHNSFDLLDDYDFVGAHITGMFDDSIIGHISQRLGLNNEERMLSGGFLVFDPHAIEIPFTNFYNEDWIWLFLQSKGKRFLQTGNVLQSKYDPFLDYKDRIIFQEFGEILLSGVSKMYKESTFENLTQEAFWENVLNERKEYLEKLGVSSEKQKLASFSKIINFLKINNSNFNSQLFQNTFNTFWESVVIFRELCKQFNN